jgi:uncharacterized RDD family membrane protein YckC
MSKVPRNVVFSCVFLWGVLACQAVFAAEPEPDERIWTAGDEKGVYLVATHRRDKQEGFQLFYRERIGNKFQYGPWYTGRPRCVTMHGAGLHLFFEDGAHLRYDLHDSRTQRRIPVGLEVLATVSYQNQLLVLVRVKSKQSVQLSELAPDPVAIDSDPGEAVASPDSDKSEPSGEPAMLSAEKDKATESRTRSLVAKEGEGLLLLLEKNEWRSLTSAAMTLEGWIQPQIGILNDTIHLFGIEGEGDRPAFAIALSDGAPGPRITLPILHLSALNVLTVNRQLRLIVGQHNPISEQGQESRKVRRYYLGGAAQEGWHFSKPLKINNDELLAGPQEQVVFAAMDQSVVVFKRMKGEEVYFASYDVNNPTASSFDVLTLHSTELGITDFWLLSPEILISQAILAAVILWWRRKDLLAGADSIPPFLEMAPLWRRAGAYFLDILPASFIAQMITLNIYPAFSPEEIMTAMMNNEDITANPAWIRGTSLYYAIFTFIATGYFLLWELFFYATPGKMLFKLQVITFGSQPPESYQVISRNFLRLLEMHPYISMVVILPLMLFTPRHQRLGDLISHTQVVTRRRGRQPDDADRDNGVEDLYLPGEDADNK